MGARRDTSIRGARWHDDTANPTMTLFSVHTTETTDPRSAKLLEKSRAAHGFVPFSPSPGTVICTVIWDD